MKALPLLASITAISLLTSNADGQQVREFTVYEAPFDGGPVSHRWGGGCIRNCFRYGGLKLEFPLFRGQVNIGQLMLRLHDTAVHS